MAAQEKEGGGGEIMRDYRKGNWTVQETMILIEAKQMDDERRKMSRSSKHGGQQQQQPQAAQPLRWKWVEEYCWRRGCQRSQNQCNDKWDNLMRDYKKVREYQRNLNEDGNNNRNDKSYWEMDRAERKEKGLPTNMLPQIYQALYDVVEKPATTTTAAVQLLPPPPAVEIPPVALLPPPPPPPPILSLPLPRPPPLSYYSHQQHVQQQPLQAQPSPTSLDAESEHSHPESPAKRRKSRDEGRIPSSTTPPPPPPPTATTTTVTAMVGGPSSSTSTVVEHLQEAGNAICRSATMIAEAIQAGEEREERRHREIVSFHESSLRLQESRMEIHRQGLNALTDAINNLANSILHWANSQKNQGGGGGPSSS